MLRGIGPIRIPRTARPSRRPCCRSAMRARTPGSPSIQKSRTSKRIAASRSPRRCRSASRRRLRRWKRRSHGADLVDAAVALHSESPAVRRQLHVAVAGGLLLGIGALALGSESWRLGTLLVIGALLGVSLYHAAFGFTSAYRRALVERDVA